MTLELIINTFQTENILTFYVGEAMPWPKGGGGEGGSHVAQLNFKKSCVSISQYSLSCWSLDKNPLLLSDF